MLTAHGLLAERTGSAHQVIRLDASQVLGPQEGTRAAQQEQSEYQVNIEAARATDQHTFTSGLSS